MRLLYSLLYVLALAFIFPFEYRKRPLNIRRRWLSEKFAATGAFKTRPQPLANAKADRALWVHAVSVGEVLAADIFIKALRKKHPDLRVVVSTITDTGQKVARERLSNMAEIIYLPFDLKFILRRAIAGLRPFIFINMETEMWPNIFWCMQDAGVPVLMLNVRISEGSFRGYKKIRFFMKKVLEAVDIVCVQDEEYAGRIHELGVPEDRVKVTGNFKFDVSLSGGKPPWGGLISGPVIVAGSTHRGEEDLMITVYEKLKMELKELNLIIAPRHPERFKEVEELLVQKGVLFVRKSALAGTGVSGTVVLLDTIGELAGVYSMADVAVMGGSFIKHGGQNPLEPAYWGKPVVCGPHMENFPFIEEFYGAGAAVNTSREDLIDVLKNLLLSPKERASIGEKAAGLLRKNRGAVDKAVEIVEGYLKGI
jgi:3-deoxy-D-manno-octulosonic-acid transferase